MAGPERDPPFLYLTIVNVALPSIQRELHFAATDREWVEKASLAPERIR
jgi:hypothetical protein